MCGEEERSLAGLVSCCVSLVIAIIAVQDVKILTAGKWPAAR